MDLDAFAIPEADRPLFLRYLALVARADGVLVAEEVQALESAIAAWSLTPHQAEAVRATMGGSGTLEGLVAEGFTERRSALLLVQEMITLAWLDGTYGDDERSAVWTIGRAHGVAPGRIEALEAWVADGIAWRDRGARLLRDEEGAWASR